MTSQQLATIRTVKSGETPPAGATAVVTISTAVKISGRCRQTIYSWIRDDHVRWIRIGGRYRIFLDSLVRGKS
jgi:hypothetical protein